MTQYTSYKKILGKGEIHFVTHKSVFILHKDWERFFKQIKQGAWEIKIYNKTICICYFFEHANINYLVLNKDDSWFREMIPT